MEMSFDYDFYNVVKEVLDEYEMDYEYDEKEDTFFTGINFEDLEDVSMVIINNGSRILIVGEIEYTVEDDKTYYNAMQFVQRFNATDCNIILFFDPDVRRLYFKKQISVLDSMDPQFSLTRDFLRINMELDVFGSIIMSVLKECLDDNLAIEKIHMSMEELNEQLMEETGQYVS